MALDREPPRRPGPSIGQRVLLQHDDAAGGGHRPRRRQLVIKGRLGRVDDEGIGTVDGDRATQPVLCPETEPCADMVAPSAAPVHGVAALQETAGDLGAIEVDRLGAERRAEVVAGVDLIVEPGVAVNDRRAGAAVGNAAQIRGVGRRHFGRVRGGRPLESLRGLLARVDPAALVPAVQNAERAVGQKAAGVAEADHGVLAGIVKIGGGKIRRHDVVVRFLGSADGEQRDVVVVALRVSKARRQRPPWTITRLVAGGRHLLLRRRRRGHQRQSYADEDRSSRGHGTITVSPERR